MVEPTTSYFRFGEHRLAYDTRGHGNRDVVLVPGLLTTRRMQWRLADRLAAAGYRVHTFDPLGFGESDHPEQYWHYSVPRFADQLAAFLDHAGLDRPVLYGTSLGSAVGFAFAAAYPDRLSGLIVEGPVLERAMPGALLFGGTILAYGLLSGRLGEVIATGLRRTEPLARRSPLADSTVDILRKRPAEIAAAMTGIINGRIALPRDQRLALEIPILAIGYRWFDPVHPRVDAEAVAAESAGARPPTTRTWFALRNRPERLTAAIVAFIHDCAASVDNTAKLFPRRTA